MLKVSCIQICSNNNTKKNTQKIIYYINQCIKKKSDFILTPETCSIMSSDNKELLNKITTMEKDELVLETKKVCVKYKKWILLGSIVVKNKKKKLVNRSVLINTKGKIDR